MSEQTQIPAANDVEQLIRDQIRDNKVHLYERHAAVSAVWIFRVLLKY